VERRYHANLNDKIAELRDSVPSLRANKGNLSGICITDGDGDGEGEEDDDNKAAIPANKLNKASILSKPLQRGNLLSHIFYTTSWLRRKKLYSLTSGVRISLRKITWPNYVVTVATRVYGQMILSEVTLSLSLMKLSRRMTIRIYGMAL
jgi:helix-loop-helix DNA-binding protein